VLLLLPRVCFFCLFFLFAFILRSYFTGLDASSQLLTNSDTPAIVQIEAEGMQVDVGAEDNDVHNMDPSLKLCFENENEAVIVRISTTL